MLINVLRILFKSHVDFTRKAVGKVWVESWGKDAVGTILAM